MQISSVSFAQPIQASQMAAPPAAASAPEREAVSDSISLGNAPAEPSVLAPQSSANENPVITKIPTSEAEICAALADILSGASEGEESGAGRIAPRQVEGFLLADGSLAAEVAPGEGLSSSRVPTRMDVVNYDYLTADQAVAIYNRDVKGNLKVVEKAVIKAYCSFAYKMMNGYLLGIKDSPTGTIKAATKCMTKALNRFELPSGCKLRRTANINELRNYMSTADFEKFSAIDAQGKTEQLAAILDARLTGTQTQRKSYLSTTIDSDYDFEDKPKVATTFYIGDNVKGIYVGTDKLSRYPDEQEYLLAPDTKATVLGVEYNPKADGLVMHVMLGDLPAEAPHRG